MPNSILPFGASRHKKIRKNRDSNNLTSVEARRVHVEDCADACDECCVNNACARGQCCCCTETQCESCSM